MEIAEVEELIRGGHPDLPGLCLALADWSAELRLLLAQTKESRRGDAPAAVGDRLGGPQPLIE
jgi:hypothetical protein